MKKRKEKKVPSLLYKDYVISLTIKVNWLDQKSKNEIDLINFNFEVWLYVMFTKVKK